MSLFRSALKVYIHLSPWRFEAITRGSELSQSALEEIEAFRISQYREKQAYLIPLSGKDRDRERELDLRSYHGRVRNRRTGEIVAVVRFCPYPFEVSSLLPGALHPEFIDHLEISRLVTSKKRSGIGRRLLIQGGCFAIESGRYRGFLAICRSGNLGIFQKFGLRSHGEHRLAGREGSIYHLISADFLRITRETYSYTRRKLAHAFMMLMSPFL